MEMYNSGVRGGRDSFSQHYSWANLKFILYKKPVIKNIFYLISILFDQKPFDQYLPLSILYEPQAETYGLPQKQFQDGSLY